MTCIVGVVDDETETIWMGCDSFAGNEHTHVLLPPNETKVFKLPLRCVGAETEVLIFGYAGTIRACQIIKYNLELPIYDPDVGLTDMEFLINEVVPLIRYIHKKNGLLRDEDGVQTSEAYFLTGWRNKLYLIEENYGVIPSYAPYLALGSGEEVAHGSLASSVGGTPVDRIQKALEAAQHVTNMVREPFYIQHT